MNKAQKNVLAGFFSDVAKSLIAGIVLNQFMISGVSFLQKICYNAAIVAFVLILLFMALDLKKKEDLHDSDS